jgi:hypothetical protein
LLLIDPLADKLSAGETPSSEEINELARSPVTRSFVYELLKHYERLDLFPEQYRSETAQAESILVHWMMHPNELQDAPDQTELIETVEREVDDRHCRFHVFRYRMPAGHRAGDAWLLGLAGPFFENDPPYCGVAGAFSRCADKHGDVDPEELVDWYIRICAGRGSG